VTPGFRINKAGLLIRHHEKSDEVALRNHCETTTIFSFITMMTMERIRMPLLKGLLIIACTIGTTRGVRAQNVATVVWANSFYGPITSGIGLAARYGVIGFGTTIFGFAGDSLRGLPIRPGAICASLDLYLAIDFNNWLALYGNIGAVPRLVTYKVPEDVAKNYQKHDVMSVGGGWQFSLVSHLMLGIGYSGVVDMATSNSQSNYNTIHSIVAQVGYRL
jgi:hypothetical protein